VNITDFPWISTTSIISVYPHDKVRVSLIQHSYLPLFKRNFPFLDGGSNQLPDLLNTNPLLIIEDNSIPAMPESRPSCNTRVPTFVINIINKRGLIQQ
jgi:hypothetical protein